MTPSYIATKTRSGRPGWSVTFRHPLRRDARGKAGLKVRRGLNTAEDEHADTLVAQLNIMLSDPRWWTTDRRGDAEREFDPRIVSAFFDGIEVGKVDSAQLREGKIRLPGRTDGYTRVQMVGITGAGKTTLLRHLIGTDHRNDRFPSTSTAKTTTAEIEIVTTVGPYRAAITFMSEFEVRAHIDECIEAACLAAVEGGDEAQIAEALLTHREERFRLSYVLGPWSRNTVSEPEHEDDFDFDGPAGDAIEPIIEEAIVPEEAAKNQARLYEYIARIKDLTTTVAQELEGNLGALSAQASIDDKTVWLELFGGSVYDSEKFTQLSLDIKDEIERRFEFIGTGELERSATGWPSLWSFETKNRDEFLKQLRWFSSNHHQQFGRLLTPLVDGMRVSGSFFPAHDALWGMDKLVLLDGQGIGHTADTVASVSTRITRRFSDVDLILLVDSAQHPMQAAALALLRVTASAGFSEKVAIAYTHFDHVKGVNFRTVEQKKDHLRSGVTNALASLRQILGPSVTGLLERSLKGRTLFLGGLDREIDQIPAGVIRELQRLMSIIKAHSTPEEATESAPIYVASGLELALRDAVDTFLRPWEARLGLAYRDGIRKEHWSRVRALCRYIGNLGRNEYDTLMPVSDLIRSLQEEISRWLSSPASWTREPTSLEEQMAALAKVRQTVFSALHDIAENRLTSAHLRDWQTAYSEVGRGSGMRRSDQIRTILEDAAPPISSAMSADARSFLESIYTIVQEAVQAAGGRFEVVGKAA